MKYYSMKTKQPVPESKIRKSVSGKIFGYNKHLRKEKEFKVNYKFHRVTNELLVPRSVLKQMSSNSINEALWKCCYGIRL